MNLFLYQCIEFGNLHQYINKIKLLSFFIHIVSLKDCKMHYMKTIPNRLPNEKLLRWVGGGFPGRGPQKWKLGMNWECCFCNFNKKPSLPIMNHNTTSYSRYSSFRSQIQVHSIALRSPEPMRLGVLPP